MNVGADGSVCAYANDLTSCICCSRLPPRSKAPEVRGLAEQIDDPDCHELTLKIADYHDTSAEQSEAAASHNESGPDREAHALPAEGEAARILAKQVKLHAVHARVMASLEHQASLQGLMGLLLQRRRPGFQFLSELHQRAGCFVIGRAPRETPSMPCLSTQPVRGLISRAFITSARHVVTVVSSLPVNWSIECEQTRHVVVKLSEACLEI